MAYTIPVLYTASYYASGDWMGQRFRVSRSHPRGRRVQWDTLPFFYPARELMSGFRSGAMDFAEFSAVYARDLEVRCEESAQLRDWLEGVPALGDFTLLCFEPADRPCHRRVLADWLVGKVPGLTLGALR